MAISTKKRCTQASAACDLPCYSCVMLTSTQADQAAKCQASQENRARLRNCNHVESANDCGGVARRKLKSDLDSNAVIYRNVADLKTEVGGCVVGSANRSCKRKRVVQ